MPKLKNIYIYKKDKYYVGVVSYEGKRKSFTIWPLAGKITHDKRRGQLLHPTQLKNIKEILP